MGSGIATFTLDGLAPDTEYYYGFRVGSKPVVRTGRFRTFPELDRAASFRFALGSCARTGSEHSVFKTIQRRAPLFFLQLGDLHYSGIKTNDRNLFRTAFETVFGSTTQGPLYENTPLVYVWDDHDFGSDGADSTMASRPAARLTYQEHVPHYPLVAGTGDVPIFQTFNVGRVRFLLSDLRSERTPRKRRDAPGKTMLGAAQKDWLKRELLKAKGSAGLVFWISSVPWTGVHGDGDGWESYRTERCEIADFLKANAIHNVCILSGDAHMIAVDDGRNGDFATGGGAPVPVLHGSPLDKDASFKGGPYSHGFHLPAKEEGCFGWVEVRDDGSEISVAFSGRNHRDEEKLSFTFGVNGDGRIVCAEPRAGVLTKPTAGDGRSPVVAQAFPETAENHVL
jgi:alkaline phosphatase D